MNLFEKCDGDHDSKPYFFIELTNYCNFNCRFCPDRLMTRQRRTMDTKTVKRLVDEISDNQLTDKPLQLHVMGEPFLHKDLVEIVRYISQKRLKVRLFTNGSLLERFKMRELFPSLHELVISTQTPTQELYNQYRRTKKPFDDYIKGIQEAVELKAVEAYATRIYIHYLNTTNLPVAGLKVVHDNKDALNILEDWKTFALRVIKRYGIDFTPHPYPEFLPGYEDMPLDCPNENLYVILPDVIVGFKKLNTFAGGMYKDKMVVNRHIGHCCAPFSQIAVLSNGTVTFCCVDYDGKTKIGNINKSTLSKIIRGKKLRTIRDSFRRNRIPLEVCQRCLGIPIRNDYDLKFGKASESFELVSGWYNLETMEEGKARWMCAKAKIKLTVNRGKTLIIKARNGNPVKPISPLTITSATRRQSFDLDHGPPKTIEFPLKAKDIKKGIIELSCSPWIPAMHFKGNVDVRELGIYVLAIDVI